MARIKNRLSGATLIEALVALILISFVLGASLILLTKLTNFETKRSHQRLEQLADSLFYQTKAQELFIDRTVTSNGFELDINFKAMNLNSAFQKMEIQVWDQQVPIYSKTYLVETKN